MTKEAEDKLLIEGDGYVDVCLGTAEWQMPDGRYILEEDFKVAGEVWRVHLNDADPFPSKPHAHCVGGKDRFVGTKLHLGNRDLYKGTTNLGRKLEEKQFERLIELIRPKFPDVQLPIPEAGPPAADNSNECRSN